MKNFVHTIVENDQKTIFDKKCAWGTVLFENDDYCMVSITSWGGLENYLQNEVNLKINVSKSLWLFFIPCLDCDMI